MNPHELLTRAINKSIAAGNPPVTRQKKGVHFQGYITGRAWGGFDGEMSVVFNVNRRVGKTPLVSALRARAGDFQSAGRCFYGDLVFREVIGNGRLIERVRPVSGVID